MEKIIIRLIIIVALFFAIYTALQQIDWITLFNVEKITSKTEEKLGDLFWDVINQHEKEITDVNIVIPIDSIISKICKANNINTDQIKLHIVDKNEINAFALPGKHLVLYSGLIKSSENEEELCGVICHEIAHMEKDHVAKKLVKEIGLSVLISSTVGNSSPEIISEAIKLLSSTAYDRNMEQEADIGAVEYMINANINPLPFAEFLRRSFGEETILEEHISWVSTHPESSVRADYIIEYSEGKDITFVPILSKDTWEQLQINLNNY